ncbi:MAG: hypothetical protein AAGB16_03255 [Pseudomonadota bacterium]
MSKVNLADQFVLFKEACMPKIADQLNEVLYEPADILRTDDSTETDFAVEGREKI